MMSGVYEPVLERTLLERQRQTNTERTEEKRILAANESERMRLIGAKIMEEGSVTNNMIASLVSVQHASRCGAPGANTVIETAVSGAQSPACNLHRMCIREEKRISIEFIMRTVCDTLPVPCLAAAKKAAADELQRVRHAAEMELAAVQKQARRDVRERDARIVENEAEIEELRLRVRTLEAELETSIIYC